MAAPTSQSPPRKTACQRVCAHVRPVSVGIASWTAYSLFLRHPFAPTTITDWFGSLGAFIVGLALVTSVAIVLPKHPQIQRLWQRWACVPLTFVPLAIYRHFDDSPYYLQIISNSTFYLPVFLCVPALMHSVLGPFHTTITQTRQAVLKILTFAGGVVMAILLLPVLYTLIMDPFVGDCLYLVAIGFHIAVTLLESCPPETTPPPTTVILPNDPLDAMGLHMHLTPREHQVFTLLATGRTAGRIASLLGVERSTVVTHIRSIYIKAGIHSQQELLDLVFPAHNTEQPRA